MNRDEGDISDCDSGATIGGWDGIRWTAEGVAAESWRRWEAGAEMEESAAAG